jgi:hypothetical protein
MKYLKFYKECLKTGSIESKQDKNALAYGGLCGCGFTSDPNFKLLFPENKDFAEMHWGYSGERPGHTTSSDSLCFDFTPFRQNIVHRTVVFHRLKQLES